ncbi:hypothetical protein EH240_30895 [Mesorhizobium tamadayense]|uniref:Uncharacterized protein n=1 Tax=Mesorhizobium tamadayense TaxID=425306 RepID=A0A3P3F2Y8_9HYPH|nr:hypothetical protein EH240_30895 [Mesorhizobium tamadayense]
MPKFVRSYRCETQEIVFDAQGRAAVETVFVGKDRQYNRRCLQPTACAGIGLGEGPGRDAEPSEFTIGPAILVASPLPVLTFRNPAPP